MFVQSIKNPISDNEVTEARERMRVNKLYSYNDRYKIEKYYLNDNALPKTRLAMLCTSLYYRVAREYPVIFKYELDDFIQDCALNFWLTLETHPIMGSTCKSWIKDSLKRLSSSEIIDSVNYTNIDDKVGFYDCMFTHWKNILIEFVRMINKDKTKTIYFHEAISEMID